MKKLLSLVLVAVLSLSLVACGGKTTTEPTEPTEPTETVTISVQAEGGWVSLYEEVAQVIMDKYSWANIVIKETGSFDNINLIGSTSATNEEVTDVFALPLDKMYGLNQNFVLASLPVKEMAERIGGFGDYDKGLGGEFQVDGDYLAFPLNVETLITFINKTNAETAGLDPMATVEINDVDGDTVLIPAWNTWFGVAMLNSANIELLGMNEDGSFFSDLTAEWADLTPEHQEFFTGLFNYFKKHQEMESPLFTGDDAWGYMDENFKTGGMNVFRIDGPWGTNGLKDLASEESIAVAPIGNITLNGNPLKHWKSGWALGVNSRIEEDEWKMKLALEFIEEIMSQERSAQWFDVAGKITPNAADDAYANLDAVSQAVVEKVMESYDAASKRPLFKEWDQVWGTWQNAAKSWASENPADAEAAYNLIKASFDALLSQLQ